MGDWIKVKADDGHELGAYVATPMQEPIGALVACIFKTGYRLKN